VSEVSFSLSGELPHWEYENLKQEKGDIVVFKEAFLLDRRPGPASMHGTESAQPVSAVGRLSLSWRNGTGNFFGEPDFETETITVPFKS